MRAKRLFDLSSDECISVELDAISHKSHLHSLIGAVRAKSKWADAALVKAEVDKQVLNS